MQNDIKKKIAIFDFDGTITKRDSFLPFILYSVGFKRFYLGLLLLCPSILFYIIKITSSKSLKEKFIRHFFSNVSYDIFKLQVESFTKNKLPKLINPQAFQCITRHIELGHRIIVISANFEDLIGNWCNEVGISEYSCTHLSRNNGYLTGKIYGKNCSGKEKVSRLKSLVGPLNNFVIYAYGDSKGDRELLQIANYPYYRKFPKNL